MENFIDSDELEFSARMFAAFSWLGIEFNYYRAWTYSTAEIAEHKSGAWLGIH